MAGAASEDDAVSLNVTPLIDIIFCLCLFFLASFHFKQLQGKLDSWLPQNVGPNPSVAGPPTVLDEMRVFVRATPGGETELAYGSRVFGTVTGDRARDSAVYDQLEAVVRTQHDEYGARAKDVPVVIDAEPRVAWKFVIEVLDRCKKNDIQKVEFAQPLPVAMSGR